MSGPSMRVRVEVNVPTDDEDGGEDGDLPLYMGSGHGFVEGELVEEAERLVLLADNGDALRTLWHPIHVRDEDGYVWMAGVAGESLPYGRGGLQTPVSSGEQVAWRIGPA